MTEGEFAKFLLLYCPEAYNDYSIANAMLICECISILLGLIPVILFMTIGISYSAKILPTYNAQCATKPLSLVEFEEAFHDKVELATIHFQ